MSDDEKAKQAASKGQDAQQEAPPKKKKRRWLRCLIYFLLLLVVLIVASPWLLSTGPGTNLVVWIGNSQIDGRLEIDDLSLSWGGPCLIEGLSIQDNDDHEVLATKQVSWSKGIWHGATSWDQFGEVKVSEPLVGLYIQQDGTTSLEDVFAKFLEGEEEPPDPDAQRRVQGMRGTLALEGGTIRVVSVDGRELLCERLDVRCDVRTLADVKAALSLNAPALPLPTSAPTAATKPAKPQTGAGTLTLNLTVSRSDVDAPFVISGDGLAKVLGPDGKDAEYSPVELKMAGVECGGAAAVLNVKSFLLRSGDLLKVTVDDTRAAFADKITLDGKLRLDADIARCLASAAPIAGMDAPPPLAGKLSWTVNAKTVEGNCRVVGNARIDSFQAGTGKNVVREDAITFEHAATINSSENRLDLDTFVLKAGTMLTLAVQKGRIGLAEMAMDGTLRLDADIARCLKSIAPLAGWDKPPAIAGKLLWTAQAKTAGNHIDIGGNTQIDGLAIGTGKEAVREPKVTLAHSVKVDTAAKTISIDQMDLVAQLLNLQMKGGIQNYDTSAILNLSGQYNGSWDRLTVLLHELAPATAETVALAGPLAGAFTVTGPASQPKIQPTFRGVVAGADLGWTSGKAYGLPIGPAKFTPAMRDAQVRQPVIGIGVSGGQARLGGTVDLRGETAVFSLPGETKLMEKIQINRDFGRLFLSYVNPIFAKVTDLKGSVSMSVKDIHLPLGEKLKTAGRGAGRLELNDLKLQPAGLLGKLVEFGGLPADSLIDAKFSGVDFVLKDGRINYDNFIMTFSENFDLKFRGSVGFDDTVNMWVSLPIRAGLLKKKGVQGPIEQYASILGEQNTRIDVPIVGTRLAPELGKIDIMPFVKKAMKDLLIKKGLKLPGGILDKLPIPGKKPAAGEKKDPTTQKKPGLLDSLGKTLGEKLRGDDPKKKPKE